MVATVAGLCAAAVTLVPRVAVEPFGLFDPSSSSPTLFNIVNSGPITLMKIKPMLGLCRLVYGENTPQRPRECSVGPLGSRMHPIFWEREDLAPGVSYTIALQDLFRPNPPAPVAAADISIIVTYRVPFTWWRQEREFRFFTKEEGDGKRYWFRK